MADEDQEIVFSPIYSDTTAQHIAALSSFVATASGCKDAALKQACVDLVTAYTLRYFAAPSQGATVIPMTGGKAKEPRPL